MLEAELRKAGRKQRADPGLACNNRRVRWKRMGLGEILMFLPIHIILAD